MFKLQLKPYLETYGDFQVGKILKFQANLILSREREKTDLNFCVYLKPYVVRSKTFKISYLFTYCKAADNITSLS